MSFEGWMPPDQIRIDASRFCPDSSTQQRGVDHTENRGVGTDAQRQCKNRDEGEALVLAELPEAKAEVPPQVGHALYTDDIRFGSAMTAQKLSSAHSSVQCQIWSKRGLIGRICGSCYSRR